MLLTDLGPVPDKVTEWIKQIVLANRGKNFVDRISNPGAYPVMKLPDGNSATHKMAWSTVGEKQTPVVYPTVVFDPGSRSLVELKPDEALNYALSSGEYLTFPDGKSADLFSKQYKRIWSLGKTPPVGR